MGYSKRQFVTSALDEIGISSYIFELQPEQLESAMQRLDAMMSLWNGRGIRLGYPLPNSPESSDLDAETGVPDIANEAIITNLALKLASSYGKQVSPETKISAASSYSALLAVIVRKPDPIRFPSGIPLGAGHKSYRHYGYGEFSREDIEHVLGGQDGPIDYY